MERENNIELVAKNPTCTVSTDKTVKVKPSLNMDAEESSEDGMDCDDSVISELDTDSCWDFSEEETDPSGDEQPGPSRRKRGVGRVASHPCTFPGCTVVFRRPGRLKAHMHLHKGKRPFQCSVAGCARNYTTSSHLKRHLKVFHQAGPKRTMEHLCTRCWSKKTAKRGPKGQPKHLSKYVREYCAPSVGANICYECGETFRFILRGRKPPVSLTLCHICGQRFETPRDFRRHERGHITYECPYMGCKSREFSYVELRKHMTQQHDSSTYTCNDCEMKFPNKASLREHVARHLNVRDVYYCPFTNEGCERKYFHVRNLRQHVATAHGKKRFTCKICSTDLCTKQKLIAHMTRIHSQDSKSKPKKPKKEPKVRKRPKLLKATMVHIMLGIRVIDDTDSKKKKGGT